MCFDFSRFYHPGRSLSKGYTLIEVLVAMAIFGSMLTLGGLALNQGLKQYQGLAEKGINFWDQAKEIGIGKSFHSMIDYYVYTRSEGWIPYFRGNENEISYVSLSPLAGTVPVIVWIRKEEGGGGSSPWFIMNFPFPPRRMKTSRGIRFSRPTRKANRPKSSRGWRTSKSVITATI